MCCSYYDAVGCVIDVTGRATHRRAGYDIIETGLEAHLGASQFKPPLKHRYVYVVYSIYGKT